MTIRSKTCDRAPCDPKPLGDKFSRLIAKEAHKRKQKTAISWRMDETYIKVKGKWAYYYRAFDTFGKTLDFMLSELRDEAATTALLRNVFLSERGAFRHDHCARQAGCTPTYRLAPR